MSIALFPYLVHVDVYSHGFRVYQFDDSVRKLCVDFCMNYVERQFVPTGRGQFEQKISKVYAAASAKRDMYFFHRGHLDPFLMHLRMNRITDDRIHLSTLPMYEPYPVVFDWSDTERKPREIQLKIMDFFRPLFPRTKVLTLQTGAGKTFTTLAAIHDMGARTVLILRAMYIDQWTKDAVLTLGLKKGEIYTVSGSKALRSIIDLAKDDEEFKEKVKLIIISNATYRNYLKSFFADPHGDSGYNCKPWEFFSNLKAAVRVIDEVHLDFHLNWIIDCVTHVFKSISLSATLVSDDMFKNSLYATMFPPNTHAPTPVFDKYIDVYSIGYRIAENQRIRYLNMMRQYGQVIYEQSIRKHPKILKNYIDMILKITDFQFFKHQDYRAGMKCVIFCGLKEMCESVTQALVVKYPDLKIRRFVDVDPDSHLIEGDIIVTTLQSCGTGKDIADLAVGISTIALSNKQANEQLVGRLRRLKNYPDITPRFYFLYNNENLKHCGYVKERKEKLRGKIRNFNELTSEFLL